MRTAPISGVPSSVWGLWLGFPAQRGASEVRWVGAWAVGRVGGGPMKIDLDLIVRRLAEVPPVRGNVRSGRALLLGESGVSRYQRKSAHLRDRDCSLSLTEFDMVDLDLTGD
jgi:hypothetical protein